MSKAIIVQPGGGFDRVTIGVSGAHHSASALRWEQDIDMSQFLVGLAKDACLAASFAPEGDVPHL
ncbi:MAG: hypothetical protein P4M13_00220 [Alphaproteobacteria bacterium]|nr:hypothetical protein [Alphaproteobacteria bacterium]